MRRAPSSPPTLDSNSFPNQQFRANLVVVSAISTDAFTVAPVDVLLNIYQTRPGDPPVSGYLHVPVDASPFVGQQVCLRFAEVDDLGLFHAGVDDVKIDLRTLRAH